MTKWGLFQESKAGLTFEDQCLNKDIIVIYHVNRIRKKNIWSSQLLFLVIFNGFFAYF